MKRLKFCIVVLSILIINLSFSLTSLAQSKQALENFENQLKPLTDSMINAKIDNQRYAANEKFLILFEDILSYPKTFSYSFEQLNNISILTPSDKRFRIYTWYVVNDFGEYENFGFVQSENKDEKEMQVYRLHDRSDEIIMPEGAKLDDSIWFGAVYYDIITTKNEDITYYTLLGWDGKDIYSQRKVIEPLSIKSSNGKPVFGASVFYREKDRKRCIFEYSPNATFLLKYDNQYTETIDRKKIKRKGKQQYINDTIRERNYMIVYDSLQSLFDGFDNLPQYNVGAYQYNGFRFEKGKWRRITGVVPRNLPNKEKDKINADPTVDDKRTNVKGEKGRLF
ncbi:MAG: hypothetical protein LBR28_04925 [Bacteroidales bacterium]|jgi:hypothetical protein|nr:hypothetical protein [Bacteroidales bacterium]